FDELLGLAAPVFLLDLTLELELAVEGRAAVGVKIGNLPEVVDPGVVEPLLDLRRDRGDALQVVRLSTRRFDATERLFRKCLGGRLGGGSDIYAGSRLAALKTVDGGAGHEIAIERDGTTRVVVAGHREVDAIGIAIRIDDGDDRNTELARFLDGDAF